jgi:hypothetical protein
VIKIIIESMRYWHRTNGHHTYITRITRACDSESIMYQADGPDNARIQLSTALDWSWPNVFQVDVRLTYEEFRHLLARCDRNREIKGEIIAFANGAESYSAWKLANPDR